MQGSIGREISVRLKNDDARAFEIIFYAWYGSILHFCKEYIYDSEASRNIVQTVFMRLWEKRNTIDIDSNLKSYLYTIARNECITYLRHLKAEAEYFRHAKEYFPDQLLSLDALSELNFGTIDLDKINFIIESTVAGLPDRCREVFQLSRYDDLKNKEIAEKLQVSVKAVEANITRALKILRENLKDFIGVVLFFISSN
jgi:RNA polymerase sigma-70 factor (ECF subfamily)